MGEHAPAFSFYAKDFMLGTVTMSLAARGAYITLLAYQWDRGSVPTEPAELGRVFGCTPSQAKNIWAEVGEKFERWDDGLWRNKRLEHERKKQAERRALLVANGRKGGRPKNKQTETKWLSEQKPENNQNESLPSPSPFPIVDPSDLQEHDRARARPPHQKTPIIGRNGHLSHAACDATLSYCVPPSVHNKLADLLAPKHGGDREAAKAALLTWYEHVWEMLVPGFVMGDAFRFWQGRFDESFASKDDTKSAPFYNAVSDDSVWADIAKKGAPK